MRHFVLHKGSRHKLLLEVNFPFSLGHEWVCVVQRVHDGVEMGRYSSLDHFLAPAAPQVVTVVVR